jgi:lipopolysaccharide export system permease protein
VLTLRDGNRYEELLDNSNQKKTLSQINYKSLQINIPLEDFKMKRTNENLFKGNEEMLNVWQLDSVADSTSRLINKRILNLANQSRDLFFSRTATKVREKQIFPAVRIDSFYNKLSQEKYTQAIQNALVISRSAASNLDALNNGIDDEKFSQLKFLIEWHKKIVISFACIILFFIGAPLGAIIKKGGLGLPVIVSVLFFLAYYILTEMYMQLALDGNMAPYIALWMPLIIFLPISIFLTYKAANDSVIFDATIYYSWIGKLKSLLKF